MVRSPGGPAPSWPLKHPRLLELSFQRRRDALEYQPDLTKFGIERLYRLLNNRVTRHLSNPPFKA